jgi:hypothetical protein
MREKHHGTKALGIVGQLIETLAEHLNEQIK